MVLPLPIQKNDFRIGFTLIELSIVLVIIGLIVGGVLVGRDLITASGVRAQVSQIEKYQTAVNTFKSKYNYLPGDIPDPDVTKFGFISGYSCTGQQGGRDGNGLVEGVYGGTVEGEGETALFWQDLSMAKLIDQKIPAVSLGTFANGPDNGSFDCTGLQTGLTLAGNPNLASIFPTARIGTSQLLYVFPLNGVNWFGMSSVTSLAANGGMYSSSTLPVTYAYNIDKKMDDGLPFTGNVQAAYLTAYASTASPAAATDSATTCYNSSTNAYSMTQNNGAGTNCALSFKFQ